MRERLVVPVRVNPEWTLESATLRLTAWNEAVLPSLGLVVPAVLENLFLASGSPHLVSLDRQLESIRVRVLRGVDEIR